MRRLWRLMLWQMGRPRYRLSSRETWDSAFMGSPYFGAEPFWYDTVNRAVVRAETREDRALTHLWQRFMAWWYWGDESLFKEGE